MSTHRSGCPADSLMGHVAVVDDDESVCVAIRRLIRTTGLSVSTFGSAELFLATLDDETPGCLVLDMNLPGMNGLELQQLLSREHPGIAIVVITSHDDDGLRERVLAAGAVAYFSKPFRGDDLIRMLERLPALEGI